MTKTIANQYLAQNAGRRYPLADDTSGIDNRSLLDLRVTVDGKVSSYPAAFLTEIDSETVGAVDYKRIDVTVKDGTTYVDKLQFYVPLDIASDSPYMAIAGGMYSFGELTVTSAVLDEEDDTYSIRFAAPTAVLRTLCVNSIQGLGATDHPYSAVISGDIVVDAGRNADPYIDGQHLRLDIFKGAGIGEKCQNTGPDPAQSCGTVLFSINGERPGSDGNIRIVGTGGITVTPDAENNAVVISLDDAAESKMSSTCDPEC